MALDDRLRSGTASQEQLKALEARVNGLEGAYLPDNGALTQNYTINENGEVEPVESGVAPEAKGDILSADAAAAVANLPVGLDGDVLTASAADVLGLTWADPAAAPQVLGPFNVYNLEAPFSPVGAELVEIPVAAPGMFTLVLIASYRMEGESNPQQTYEWEYGALGPLPMVVANTYTQEASPLGSAGVDTLQICLEDPVFAAEYPVGPTIFTLHRKTAGAKRGKVKVVVFTLPDLARLRDTANTPDDFVPGITKAPKVELAQVAAPAAGMQLAYGHMAASLEALPAVSHDLLLEQLIVDSGLYTAEKVLGDVAIFSAQFVFTTVATNFVWDFPISRELQENMGAMGGTVTRNLV